VGHKLTVPERARRAGLAVRVRQVRCCLLAEHARDIRMNIRSVDCVAHTHCLPIPLLACPNGTHWYAVGRSAERPCAAKKRPGNQVSSIVG
jgi:hypothetical protein